MKGTDLLASFAVMAMSTLAHGQTAPEPIADTIVQPQPKGRLGAILTSEDVPPTFFGPNITQVYFEYVVSADGRAEQCQLTQGSSSAGVERYFCRIIESRFRFVPGTINGIPAATPRRQSFAIPLKRSLAQ